MSVSRFSCKYHTHPNPDSSVKVTVNSIPPNLQPNISVRPQGLPYISFTCKRKVEKMDSSMEDIISSIQRNKIQELLSRNTEGCLSDHYTGHCGNIRDKLSECACPTLNRDTFPHLRRQFEDAVIAQAIKLCKSDLSYITPDQFQFNIAMFATGGLHGELVLIIRLVQELKKISFVGTINLFLIDKDYRGNINLAVHKMQTTEIHELKKIDYLGHRLDLQQFLFEIALILNPDILVTGTVFGSSESYIDAATDNEEFKHDLLIGADIVTPWPIVHNIKTRTQKTEAPGIVLITNQNDQPNLCEIGNQDGERYCKEL